MKILHVGQLVGGLDVYIRNAVVYSSEENEYIVVHGIGDNANPIVKNGKSVKEYSISLFRSLNLIKDIKGLIQTIRIINQEQPDVIHCHSAKGGFVGRVAGFLTKTKTFYTPHAFSFLSSQNRIKQFLFLTLERLARLNSFVICCSESEKDLAISKVHYNPTRVFVWKNSVPDAAPLVKEVEKINCPYVCYIGRPSYQKNSLFLVDVVEKVHEKLPDLKFLLLGVGYYSPDLDALKDKIKNAGVEEVIKLLPWVDHGEVLGYVKQSLLYLTVSRYEGLPLAVVEALSLSKTVIASNVIGNKDCVEDGVDGYLLPLDATVFAKKIHQLLTDDCGRREMEQNARHLFVENFEISKRIILLEEIYKK